MDLVGTPWATTVPDAAGTTVPCQCPFHGPVSASAAFLDQLRDGGGDLVTMSPVADSAAH